MAFRFNIKHGEESQTTDWFIETSVLAAPMIMGQIRAMFPKAQVEIERGNALNAKDPNEAAKSLKALE